MLLSKLSGTEFLSNLSLYHKWFRTWLSLRKRVVPDKGIGPNGPRISTWRYSHVHNYLLVMCGIYVCIYVSYLRSDMKNAIISLRLPLPLF